MTDGDRRPYSDRQQHSLKALYRAPVTSVTSVTRRSPVAWRVKSEHRCDYCGSALGGMRPWDWPPDNPTRTIWLHERCEAPWQDSDGAPEGVR
jgi:hypothetical protein